MAVSSDHNSAKPRPRARRPIYPWSTSHKESEYVIESEKFFPIFSLVLPVIFMMPRPLKNLQKVKYIKVGVTRERVGVAQKFFNF